MEVFKSFEIETVAVVLVVLVLVQLVIELAGIYRRYIESLNRPVFLQVQTRRSSQEGSDRQAKAASREGGAGDGT